MLPLCLRQPSAPAHPIGTAYQPHPGGWGVTALVWTQHGSKAPKGHEKWRGLRATHQDSANLLSALCGSCVWL